jgi:Sap, sulfolipid-1-addressing protein
VVGLQSLGMLETARERHVSVCTYPRGMVGLGFLAVLPLAFVMVAGPQVITAMFLAMSEEWKKTSAAFVGGGALSVTSVYSVSYFAFRFVPQDAGHMSPTAGHWIDRGILFALLVVAVLVFRNRRRTEPPAWMGRLESASAKLSFRLGFLLLGFFPSDVVTSVTVGAHLARRSEPWALGLVFVAMTVVLLGLPALTVLGSGNRAAVVLPSVRSWMNEHSWIVSECAVALFIVLTAKDLVG